MVENVAETAAAQGQIDATVGQSLTAGLKKPQRFRKIRPTKEYDNLEIDNINAETSKPQKAIPEISPFQKMIRDAQEKERLEEQLEDDVKEDILGDDFLDGNEYTLLCQSISDNDFKEFDKLKKSKKVEMLIRLYKDPQALAEKTLGLILPYTDALSIKTSFRFIPISFINEAKQILLLKRLAPEQSELADDALIPLLLSSNASVLAKSDINTLLELRKKDYLGSKYYKSLMKKNRGRMTKKDHQKLAKLSAKITTICYAYYVETASETLIKLQHDRSALTKDTFKPMSKGMSKNEKRALARKLRRKKILSKTDQINPQKTNEELRNDIKAIMAETLKMTESFQSSIKSGS